MGRSAKQVSHSHEDDDRTSNTENYSVSEYTNVELPIQCYVPEYLKQLVFPCAGDFCQSPCFHRRLIAQLMAEGESLPCDFLYDISIQQPMSSMTVFLRRFLTNRDR